MQPARQSSDVLFGGLLLPESPRWHDGSLWFVDMFAGRVLRWDGAGGPVVVAEFEGEQTSGLGFLPDGTPVVALKFSRRIVRLDAERSTLADLSTLGGHHVNDMIVGRNGRAYVDVNSHPPGHTAPGGELDRIAIVEPDGHVRVGVEDVAGPNGLALAPDGRRLYVAESRGSRISVWTVASSDGALSDRRVLAETPGRRPDGLCLDAQGGVWFASPPTHEFVRVADGEFVTALSLPQNERALACAFGGPDRATLFLCSADLDVPTLTSRGGWLRSTTPGPRGAGRP